MSFLKSKWGRGLGLLILIGLLWIVPSGRFDLSLEQFFSLSKQGKQVLETLETPITIASYFHYNGFEEELTSTLLQSIAKSSPWIRYSAVSNPAAPADPLENDSPANGSIILRSEFGSTELNVADFFSIEGDYDVFRGEEYLINAIASIDHQQKMTVYFTEGHKEPSIFQDRAHGIQALSQAIEAVGGTVLTLNPSMSIIPEECQLLMVVSPKTAWDDQAIQNLNDYLDRGGRLIVFFDPFFRSGLEEVLEKRGVTVQETLIVDEEASYLLGSTSLSPLLMPHPITKPLLKSQMGVAFFQSRSIQKSNTASSLDYIPLLSSSDSAWADSDDPLRKDRDFSLNGPFDLAGLIENIKDDSAEKWMVFGDADWVNNQWIETQGNFDLIMAAISYLIDTPNYIHIPSKKTVITAVWFSPRVKLILFGGLVLLIPILSFALAFRSHRKKP